MTEELPAIIAMLLKQEIAQVETVQSEMTTSHSANLSMIVDGKMLTPRKTRELVISAYETQEGRKLSKKEQNLAMQTIRKALSKATPEIEEAVKDESTGKMVILKGGITWGDSP